MTKFDFKQWIINNKAKNKHALNENYNEGMCEACGGMPHEGSCMGEGEEELEELATGWGCCCKWTDFVYGPAECTGGWGCRCDRGGPLADKNKMSGGMDKYGLTRDEMMYDEDMDEMMYDEDMDEMMYDEDMLDEQGAIDPTNSGGPTSSAPASCGTQYATSDCHAFSKCDASYQDDGNVRTFGNGSSFLNPQDFWADLGSPTTIGQHIKTSNGTVFIYQGTNSTVNHVPQIPAVSGPQNICGCLPGCINPAATNYDPNATCDDGSCIMPPSGFSECQNCCCRSSMQAKLSGIGDPVGISPNGTLIYNTQGEFGDKYDLRGRDLTRENISPTIDAIYKLMKLAEQKKRFPTSDRERDGAKSSVYSNPGNPIVAGPCAMSHYPNGIGSPVGGYTPDPSFMIDPVTGMCECNSSDPNNIFGNLTTTGYMNPNPGTPNTTGTSNGTGAC